MNIKYKIIDKNIKGPQYSRKEDACFDMYCRKINHEQGYIEYKLNAAFEIPEGFVGLLFPRSSITDKDLMVKNSVGIIDPNYRGEVSMRCTIPSMATGHKKELYNIGDKCAQMMIIINPKINLIESNKLSETSRGDKGYGSSGK